MANNPVPVENYPSSSQDGEAIPLAAVRPLGCFSGAVTSSDPLLIELPEDINLISFYATTGGKLKHSREAPEDDGPIEARTVATPYEQGTFRFLPGVMYELVLAKYVVITVSTDADYFINVLLKWGQMRNEGSYARS